MTVEQTTGRTEHDIAHVSQQTVSVCKASDTLTNWTQLNWLVQLSLTVYVTLDKQSYVSFELHIERKLTEHKTSGKWKSS